MSLPEIVLDDLEWEDMVDAVRAQIAAASAEHWTLHAAVDPGVTLLELFAYALEQRVYWLDRVSDPLILAMLALLGETPNPAQAAKTIVELYGEDPTAVDVAAGTNVQRTDDESTTHFRTHDAVTVLPIERLRLRSDYGTREANVDDGLRWRLRPLTLFPADGRSAEFRVTLFTRGELPPGGGVLNLLLDVDTPDGIDAQWSHDAAESITPAATLHWQYTTGTGRATLATANVRDGTQSLRRSGLLSIDLPSDWQADGPPEDGLFRYSLWSVTGAANYSAPPQLVRIVPNAVSAAHEHRRSLQADSIKKQIADWLPLPGLSLQLDDTLPPLEDSVELRIRERDGQWHEWTRTTDLGRHGPGDRRFALDRELYRIDFGDGLTTRIPQPEQLAGDSIELRYLGGGGTAGNVGENLRWQVPAHATLLADNPLAASGGRETESLEAASDRAAAALARRERAVTAEDFETLALTTPGIGLARAYAAIGFHPGFPCHRVPGAATVFIVPDVPRGPATPAERRVAYPQPDPGAIAEVLERLDERRLVTTEVFVRGPTYRRVAINASLIGHAGAAELLRDRIKDRLEEYFDPLIGGEAGKGWPFGNAVRPSEIAHVIDTVAGNDAQVDKLTLDVEGQVSDCEDIEIAAHELVRLDAVKLTWATAETRRGGLR